jgi:hypothetical protein
MKVYMHGENNPKTEIIDIPENSSFDEIIVLYKDRFGHQEVIEEIFLFDQDAADCHGGKDNHHFKDRHHVHAHRCKSIKVQFSYNGTVKDYKFPPSSNGHFLLKKAEDLFGIKPADAANLMLMLENKQVIENTDHLCSFTRYPVCAVVIFVVPNPQIKG